MKSLLALTLLLSAYVGCVLGAFVTVIVMAALIASRFNGDSG